MGCGRGRLALALVGLLLGGCGVRKAVSDYFAGEPNTAPPAPLVEFRPLAAVKERWSVRLGKGTDERYLKLAPQALGDRLYVAEEGGRVAALEAATGRTVWQRDLDVPISGGPGVGEGLVLVGTADGEVVALEEAGGRPLWRAAVPSEVLSVPAAANGVVVVHSADGRVSGLDAATGRRVWAYDRSTPTLSLRGTSSPKLVGGELVLVGFDNGRLVALELKTGKLLWETPVAVASGRSDLERMVDIDADPVVAGQTVYVVTFQGRLAAIDLGTGQSLWSRTLSSYAGLGVDEGNLYLTDAEGMVWALDRESGAALWKQDRLGGRAATAPAVVGQYVVVGDLEGYLHWLRREDGQFAARVRVDDSRFLVAPVESAGVLYAYTSGGTLAAYVAE